VPVIRNNEVLSSNQCRSSIKTFKSIIDSEVPTPFYEALKFARMLPVIAQA
jgi:hypothetical protein